MLFVNNFDIENKEGCRGLCWRTQWLVLLSAQLDVSQEWLCGRCTPEFLMKASSQELLDVGLSKSPAPPSHWWFPYAHHGSWVWLWTNPCGSLEDQLALDVWGHHSGKLDLLYVSWIEFPQTHPLNVYLSERRSSNELTARICIKVTGTMLGQGELMMQMMCFT